MVLLGIVEPPPIETHHVALAPYNIDTCQVLCNYFPIIWAY